MPWFLDLGLPKTTRTAWIYRSKNVQKYFRYQIPYCGVSLARRSSLFHSPSLNKGFETGPLSTCPLPDHSTLSTYQLTGLRFSTSAVLFLSPKLFSSKMSACLEITVNFTSLRNLLQLSITSSQIKGCPTKGFLGTLICTMCQKPDHWRHWVFFTARWSGGSDASSPLASVSID